jgi:transcriptional regulator with XRE-family HTH domain
MENFHARLKRLRERRGLTMKEMAKAVGVPESTYREWEYGRAIQGEPYIAIASVLEVTLQELLSGKKPNRVKVLEKIDQIEGHLRELRTEVTSFL